MPCSANGSYLASHMRLTPKPRNLDDLLIGMNQREGEQPLYLLPRRARLGDLAVVLVDAKEITKRHMAQAVVMLSLTSMLRMSRRSLW